MNLSHPRPSREKILIVEDDPSIRAALQELLRMEGFEVTTSVNGAQALETLRTFDATLILLDMMMPVMNGREFMDRLAADPRLAHVPVLVLSATALPIDTHGAQARLRKPPEVSELLRAIDLCLGPPSAL